MLTTLLLLTGCGGYEVFMISGAEQVGFTNDADILFLIDNSDSMTDEAEQLALNFSTFISNLTSETTGANAPRETLGDAVGNYLHETDEIGLFIDFRIAITTTSVDYSSGGEAGVEPGEAGTLAGEPTIIKRTDADVESTFQRNLLCNATCWNSNTVPNDPGFVCPSDPETKVDPGSQVTEEFLDCICGTGAWKNHCGAGNEEGLEAAWMALCRSVENPPDECFSFIDPEDATGSTELPSVMLDDDIMSNGDFLREDTVTLVVIVTDEGDGSRRLLDGDSEVSLYQELFTKLPNPVRVAVIGPPYHDNSLACNSGGATTWGAERYTNIAALTGGTYIDIEAQTDGSCGRTDFSENLQTIGDLLNQLATVFPLAVIPDPETIEVFVDDQAILQSEITSGTVEAGDAEYSEGWSYDASYNAVSFNKYVPDYNADIKIYYRPIGENPREIPF
jgi:hypothetical protein